MDGQCRVMTYANEANEAKDVYRIRCRERGIKYLVH